MILNNRLILTLTGLSILVLALIDNNLGKAAVASLLVACSIFLNREHSLIAAWSMILILCLFVQWGVGQFILQHDLGLRYVGESVLSKSTSGVAKFGDSIMRGYGPFEHANIYGGLSLLALILFTQIRRGSAHSYINYLIVFVLGLGVFVSFSRAAMAGWIWLMLISSSRTKREGKIMIQIFALLSIVFLPLLLQRVTDQRDVAASERWRGYGWSAQIIKSNSVWYGNGLADYKVELRSFLDNQGISYQPWEIDYAHSVPLMIVAQFGIVGGGVLLVVIGWWLVRILPRESFMAILALGPALVLDHYFITKPVALMYLLITVIMIMKINYYKVKSV